MLATVAAAHKFDSSIDPGVTDFKPSEVNHPFRIDNSKSKRVLGIEYITLEECMRDVLAQFKELKWY
jgi:nucleoside-diphosphate-sugar epimerase